MEEESPDEAMHDDPTLSTTKIEKPKGDDSARDEFGSSFDELIDRLLALPMTKQDGKFVPVFLCLYRKFSSPSQVLSAIIARFARVENSSDAPLTKVGEQLRYLQVLALWTCDYPGDFAQPTIKKDVIAFVVGKLEKVGSSLTLQRKFQIIWSWHGKTRTRNGVALMASTCSPKQKTHLTAILRPRHRPYAQESHPLRNY